MHPLVKQPSTIPFFGQAVTLAVGAGGRYLFPWLSTKLFLATALEKGIRERQCWNGPPESNQSVPFPSKNEDETQGYGYDPLSKKDVNINKSTG